MAIAMFLQHAALLACCSCAESCSNPFPFEAAVLLYVRDWLLAEFRMGNEGVVSGLTLATIPAQRWHLPGHVHLPLSSDTRAGNTTLFLASFCSCAFASAFSSFNS